MTVPAVGERVTQAEFARRQGWSRAYVTKLKHEGRIVHGGDGLVDVEASVELIRDTTGAMGRAGEAVQGPQFKDAADREKYYAAELKRLEYERVVRELMPVDEVHAAVDSLAVEFRAAIESLEQRLLPHLEAIGADGARVRALLSDETEQILASLSRRLEQLAKGGE